MELGLWDAEDVEFKVGLGYTGSGQSHHRVRTRLNKQNKNKQSKTKNQGQVHRYPKEQTITFPSEWCHKVLLSILQYSYESYKPGELDSAGDTTS